MYDNVMRTGLGAILIEHVKSGLLDYSPIVVTAPFGASARVVRS